MKAILIIFSVLVSSTGFAASIDLKPGTSTKIMSSQTGETTVNCTELEVPVCDIRVTSYYNPGAEITIFGNYSDTTRKAFTIVRFLKPEDEAQTMTTVLQHVKTLKELGQCK